MGGFQLHLGLGGGFSAFWELVHLWPSYFGDLKVAGEVKRPCRTRNLGHQRWGSSTFVGYPEDVRTVERQLEGQAA